MQTINHSYRSLRKVVGALGMGLPFLLIVGNSWVVEGSISFYYYTKMSTVFTGILVAFGLILITYRGTDQTPGFLNENVLTNIAGACALLVALVPTKFGSCTDMLIYAHNDAVRGWIHNISAVLFIFLMGLVVLMKFGEARYFQITYRVLGTIVLLGLLYAIYSFVAKVDQGIFWGETVAIFAFGVAWLRRGVPKKVLKNPE